MKLYFLNSYNEIKLIADNLSSKEECSLAIKKFLDEHNFKSYYTRTWIDENNITWYDVGSHSEFFLSSEKSIDKEMLDKSYAKWKRLVLAARIILNKESVLNE